MSEIAQFLPWLNVLIIPGIGYIIRLERRILTLEIMIGATLGIKPATLGGMGKPGA